MVESNIGVEFIHVLAESLVRLVRSFVPPFLRMNIPHELSEIDDPTE